MQAWTNTSPASWNEAACYSCNHEPGSLSLNSYRGKTNFNITSALRIFSHSHTMEYQQIVLPIIFFTCHSYQMWNEWMRAKAPSRNVPHTCKLSAHTCFPCVPSCESCCFMGSFHELHKQRCIFQKLSQERHKEEPLLDDARTGKGRVSGGEVVPSGLSASRSLHGSSTDHL